MFIVHLRDGRAIHEDEVIDGIKHDWKKIKEITNNLQDITSLQIKHNGIYHTLSADGRNIEFIQLKSNIMNIVTGEDRLVERVLGFFIKEEGQAKYAIKLRINEKTGGTKLTLEIKTEKGWKAV